MKKFIFLLIAFTGIFFASSHAQMVCPPNSDFEIGDYSVWKYYVGSCCTGGGSGILNTPLLLSTPLSATYIPCSFALTGTAPGGSVAVTGVDPFGGFPVVGAGNYSLRIGSTRTNAWANKAQYYVHVPAGVTNYSLIYRYAVVMEDAGHAANQQPRFVVTATDSNTNTLLPCGNFSYVAGALPGFVGPVSNAFAAIPSYGCAGQAPAAINGRPATVFYKPWATASINLDGYGGHTVIVGFTAGDCQTTGHFGYGYVDMSCGLFAINITTGAGGCSSSSVQLTAPSGFSTYAWYNATFSTLYGATATISVPAPSTPTVYAVILTPFTGFGCKDTLYTTVNPSSAPVISGVMTLCVGGTTTLSSSIFGGTWSSGTTSVATIDPSGIVYGVSTGTSVITYALPGGCDTTATVTVTPSPTPITGTTNVCLGSTTALSDAIGGGAWTSSNASVATIDPSGIVYSVSAGTSNISYTIGSCATGVVVTVGSLPPITGGNMICASTTLSLSDATTGGVWTSDNTTVAVVSASGVVTGVSGGTANISYTVGSCAAGELVTVGSLTPITGDSTLCAGSTTSLSNATGSGTWSSDNTAVATVGPTGIVYGVSAGFAWITYNTGGCFTRQLVSVSPSAGAGTITGPTGVCVGATITLSDAVAGGVWGISNGNATLSGADVTGASQGIDTVTYTVSSPACGTAVATTIISIDLPPDAGTITGDTTVCAGNTINLSDPATGGVWSSSNNTVATVAAGVVFARSAGTAIIGYAVTNACGTASVTKTITVFASPVNSPITGQDSACVNATFMLSDATPGGHWTNTNPTVLSVDDSGKVRAFTSGTATIIYTTGPNAGGCSTSVNFQVTVSFQGTFVVHSIVTPVSCYGSDDGGIHLSTDGPQVYQYLWNSGESGAVITNLPPGYDTVSIKAEITQCLEVLVYHITQPDSLEVTATSKNDTCDAGKGSISLVVTGGTHPYTYHWSDNKTTENNTGLTTGTYSVTVTDSNGCTKSIAATVQQDSCNAIIIHDVMTPNGDGKNDTWQIDGIQNYPANSVQVFDKWGDMIYSKTGYDNNWNGGTVPDGTYFYLVKLNTKNLTGGQNTWTGSLLIKR